MVQIDLNLSINILKTTWNGRLNFNDLGVSWVRHLKEWFFFVFIKTLLIFTY